MSNNLQFNTKFTEKVKVNYEQGEILGVVLLEQGEASGHNLLINDMTIKSFADVIGGDTVKCYLTHDGADHDRALEVIGAFSDIRIEADGDATKLVGDLSLLNSFRENNKQAYDTLFELADDDQLKNLIGLSSEFHNAPVILDDDGNYIPYEGQEGVDIYAQAIDVSAFSIVAEPAATNGLFNVGDETDEVDEDEAFELWAKKLEADNKELSELVAEKDKQLDTVMKLAKQLQADVVTLSDQNEKLSVELNSDAPFIEPHFEQEQPNILEQLKTFSNSAERSKFVLDNLQEIWGKRGVVDNRT